MFRQKIKMTPGTQIISIPAGVSITQTFTFDNGSATQEISVKAPEPKTKTYEEGRLKIKYQGDHMWTMKGFIFIDGHILQSAENAIVFPHRNDHRLISLTDGTKNIIQTNDEVTVTSGDITAKLKNIKGKDLNMFLKGYLCLDGVPVPYNDPRLVSITRNGKDLREEYKDVPEQEERKSHRPRR